MGHRRPLTPDRATDTLRASAPPAGRPSWSPETVDPRPSFVQEHWRGIAAFVIGGVLVAAILGGATRIEDAVRDWLREDIDPAALGNWEFVGFEPGPPDPPMTDVTYRYKSLQLRDDDTYTVTGTLVLGNGPSLAFGDSGTYAAGDDDSVRFESRTEDGRFWVFDLAVEADELRLFDPAERVTHVFRRVQT